MTDKEFLLENRDLFERMDKYYFEEEFHVHYFEVYGDGIIVDFGYSYSRHHYYNIWRVGEPGYGVVQNRKDAKNGIDNKMSCPYN